MIETKMAVYSESIFEMAEEKRDEMFYNSSMEHAIIVHQALVKYATSYMDILCGDMCSEISNNDDYCQLMEDFLKKPDKPQINIIFTNYSDTFREKPIAKVFKKYSDQVHIKRSKLSVIYEGEPSHFAIADDAAFRLETDINNHMAFGNFNSPSTVKVLKDTFDKIFISPLTEKITTI